MLSFLYYLSVSLLNIDIIDNFVKSLYFFHNNEIR